MTPLPPELDPRRPPVRRRGAGRRVLGWVAGLTSATVILVSAGGYALAGHYEAKIQRIDPFSGLTARPVRTVDTAQTYLLVGSDNRQGLTREQIAALHLGRPSATNGAGRRTDTMILLHVSQDRAKATLISLPRDSYVEIPAYTDSKGKRHAASHNKLNAAFELGGPQLTIATVEKATGVRVDHYVEIGFDGFVQMVDAVGGVSVCSTRAVTDPKSGLRLKEGRNTLNGTKSLAYVRARYIDPTADLGRMKRQQAFLGTLFRKATSSGVLLNPVKLNGFLDAVLQSVRTDEQLTRQDMVDLATKTGGLSPRNVVFATVPLSNVDYRAGGVGSSVLWDPVKSRTLFAALRDDKPIGSQTAAPTASAGTAVTVAPSKISVRVYNGAGVQGLGAKASTELQTLGYLIAAPATNAAATGATVTVIEYDPRFDVSLKTLQAAFPAAQVKAVAGIGKMFRVTVGSAYQAPRAVTVVTAPSASSSDGLRTTSAADSTCPS